MYSKMIKNFKKDLKEYRVKVTECYEKIKELCNDTKTLDKIAANRNRKLILRNDDKDWWFYPGTIEDHVNRYGNYIYTLTNGKYRVYDDDYELWEFAHYLKMYYIIDIKWSYNIPKSLFEKYQDLVTDKRKEILDGIIRKFKRDLMKEFDKGFVRNVIDDLECAVFYKYWRKD